jgi:hypothetical protein
MSSWVMHIINLFLGDASFMFDISLKCSSPIFKTSLNVYFCGETQIGSHNK